MTAPSSTPLIQDFSLPAGDEMQVNFTITPVEAISLIGSSITWKAYPQQHGMITDTANPVISKALDAGIEIDDPALWLLHVTLVAADTADLLGNYRHSLKITIEGNTITVADGVMTVTESI